MMFGTTFLTLAALAGSALGHMQMTSPPPLGSSFNQYTGSNIDYDMIAPLGAGANGGAYPCRGHLNLLGTDSGKSVATWAAGSTQSLTIAGGAFHNGGSCQAMLSYDNGNSWTVIKSWIGNCPISSGGSFSFKVPADAPAGNPVFAWSWFNHSGNREMYQNCAAITITGGSGSESTPFAQRPAPFLANIPGTSCATIEGGDVVFPNPGPDVENTSSNPNQPAGDCGASVTATVPTGNNLVVEPSSTPAAAETPTDATTVAPTTTVSDGAAATSSAAPARQCKRYRKRSYPVRMH